MAESKRVALLVAVLTVVAMGIGVCAILLLYRTGFE